MMNLRHWKNVPFPRTPRWADYDYSRPGAYYVTIATAGRLTTLGRSKEGRIDLTRIGEIVDGSWLDLAKRFETVELDSYVVMPDHFHGIIHLNPTVPIRRKPSGQSPSRPTLMAVIGAFLSLSTIEVNRSQSTPGQKLWQRSFYERVVRNDRELDKFRGYIMNNPAALALQRSGYR